MPMKKKLHFKSFIVFLPLIFAFYAFAFYSSGEKANEKKREAGERFTKQEKQPLSVQAEMAVCSHLSPMTVPPVAGFEASATEVCAGGCIQFTDLSLNNPTSWLWSFDGVWPVSSTDPGPVNVCFNVPGTYTISLQVTNQWGTDIEVKTDYITVFPNPDVDLGNDTTICDGDTLILDAGAGPFTYQWHPSGNTHQIVVTTGGSYSVTVIDPNGCWGRGAVNVNVLQQMNAGILTNDTIVCEYETAFMLFATDSGGVWAGAGITNPANGWFNPSTAGTGIHEISYTIAGLCGDSDTILITVIQSPSVNLGNDTTICTGDTLLLDAGSNGVTYLWSTGDTTQIIAVFTTGIYSVTVTDSLSCYGFDSVYVLVTDYLFADIVSAGPFCSNDTAIQLIAYDTGGVWSGPGITDTSGGWFDPSVAGDGIHQIIYHISGSCGDTDSTEITVLPAPLINLGNDTILCVNDTIVLDAGSGNDSYLWSTGDTTQTITVLNSGSYSVIVSNTAGCYETDSIYVEIIDYWNAEIITTGPFCSNEGLIQMEATDQGGLWYHEFGNIDPTTGLFNTTYAGAGIHMIIYTIPDPCGDYDTVYITVYAAPEIPGWNDTIICLPDTLILDAGSTGFETYLWSTGDTTQTIVVYSDGLYSVTISNDECVSVDSIQVTFEPQLDATIYNQGPFCLDDDPVHFSAVDDGGIWSGNGISSGGLFDPYIAGPGDHIIVYMIDGICGDTDSITVTVFDSPILTTEHTDETCEGYNNGTATVIISGGTPPYVIQWSNGGTTEMITGLAPGTYYVTVTDVNGCEANDWVHVYPGPECNSICVNCNGICNGNSGFFPGITGGDGSLSEITGVELKIFSRWGELVFESNDMNNKWYGDYKGQPLEPAVFVFFIKLVLFNGDVVTQTGDVTLIR